MGDRLHGGRRGLLLRRRRRRGNKVTPARLSCSTSPTERDATDADLLVSGRGAAAAGLRDSGGAVLGGAGRRARSPGTGKPLYATSI